MPSYGPMTLVVSAEPREFSSVVAEDGTGTFRHGFGSHWTQAGRDESLRWADVQSRMAGRRCWVITPASEHAIYERDSGAVGEGPDQ